MPPSTDACFQATTCSDPFNVGNNAGVTSYSSQTILVNEQVTNTSPRFELDATLCHEFFHLLEWARAPGVITSSPKSWITEASATWAETVYVAKSDDASRFFSAFQHLGTSLESLSSLHQYGAAVWLVWLTQLVGGASGVGGHSAVFGLWRSFGAHDVSSAAGVDTVINSLYPWAKDWPAFSEEDLDEQQLSPDVTPYLFHDASSEYPIGEPPRGVVPQSLPVGRAESVLPSLPPLSSFSEYFNSIAGSVRDVNVDFTDVGGSTADEHILADVSGRWRTFDVPIGVTFMNFCFDNSGEKVSNSM